ncbi:MAG: hypothetical protein A2136_01910 [Chloroflexi bacterium RBG_16_54_11]|nr:MAG: hypothetical protein A2136_01910 [Chloroflexi bacterium RBG_16_54_11]
MPSKPIRSAETRRKILAYIAIGVVTLIILIVTLATAGRQQSLRCERLETGEVDCLVRQSILGLITLNEKTIGGAQAVSIGQQCVDVKCTYRLEIFATQGLVPITEKYTSNYDQQLAIKSQLNEFFTDKSRSFVGLKEETNPILIVAVLAVAIIIWSYLGYLSWLAQHPEGDKRLTSQ